MLYEVITNILIASTAGLYEIEPKKSKIVRKHIFDTPLHYIESIFVSSDNEIFLLTGLNGIIYYIKDFNTEPQTLSNLSTALVLQLVEFDDMIIGGSRITSYNVCYTKLLRLSFIDLL